jgi:hypothetical protein
MICRRRAVTAPGGRMVFRDGQDYLFAVQAVHGQARVFRRRVRGPVVDHGDVVAAAQYGCGGCVGAGLASNDGQVRVLALNAGEVGCLWGAKTVPCS